ncbi:MAG TPA: hypothetical protein VGE52_20045, partial [Pirellulales bacterium]
MPIVVRCERCGQRYQVGDQLAGRSLNCKGCGAVMGVPAAGSGADAGLAPLDLGGPAGADVNGLFGAAPAAPSPYGARPAAPAPYGQAAPYGQPSPYGQPAGPYGQPASPYAQPNPTGHQPTGGGLGYQYPAPAP